MTSCVLVGSSRQAAPASIMLCRITQRVLSVSGLTSCVEDEVSHTGCGHVDGDFTGAATLKVDRSLYFIEAGRRLQVQQDRNTAAD